MCCLHVYTAPRVVVHSKAPQGPLESAWHCSPLPLCRGYALCRSNPPRLSSINNSRISLCEYLIVPPLRDFALRCGSFFVSAPWCNYTYAKTHAQIAAALRKSRTTSDVAVAVAADSFTVLANVKYISLVNICDARRWQ